MERQVPPTTEGKTRSVEPEVTTKHMKEIDRLFQGLA